jgi:guanine deaminase
MADHAFMEMAIDLAMKNVQTGAGGPFGAVVVKDGKVIAAAANCVTSSNDPTAHAEVMAIRKACQVLGSFQLDGCEIYTYYANTRAHAADAGFDDAFIYDEISLAPEERTLKMAQLRLPTAHEHFEAWVASQLQVKY